jgi:hypothetical protein
MEKLEEFNIEPVLLPEECERYLVGGHQWIKVKSKHICMYCQIEKDKSKKSAVLPKEV